MDTGIIAYAAVGAVASASLYGLSRPVRRFARWAVRNEQPLERGEVFAPIYAILGVVVGCLAHELWQDVKPCQDAGQPIMACVFSKR